MRRIYDGREGCKVRGITTAGQEVTITPGRACEWKGKTYLLQSVKAIAEPDGSWYAVLPPSEVAGAYTVNIGGRRFTIRVPDEAKAKFEDLIKG